MNRKRELSEESLETLERRLASWRSGDVSTWLKPIAPKVIAELEVEIERRK